MKKKIFDTCVICGYSKRLQQINSQTYCSMHSLQLKKYGKIIRPNRITHNEIIEYDGYAEIVLYDKRNFETGRATIDAEDIDKIKDITWWIGDGKVSGKIKGKNIALHHIIKDFIYVPENKLVVDHIDRNFLNNKKENLRIVSQKINSCNTKIPKNNTSGTVGVIWDKFTDSWKASIMVNRKNINLGRFKNIQDAITARKNGELKYFGEIINGR
jgi:hypothetical protein